MLGQFLQIPAFSLWQPFLYTVFLVTYIIINHNCFIGCRYVHLKEKNFGCSHCDYRTLFKSDLTKHENAVHHGIRRVKKKKEFTHKPCPWSLSFCLFV
jgi:hypothetical protein